MSDNVDLGSAVSGESEGPPQAPVLGRIADIVAAHNSAATGGKPAAARNGGHGDGRRSPE